MTNQSHERGSVDYSKLDPFKVLAQQAAESTVRNHIGFYELPGTRGESAYVWESVHGLNAIAHEGLGTKNLVADRMREITGRTHYDTIAQDTVAMIVNDLITSGAKPDVITAHFSVAEESWFDDKERVLDLVNGWANACKMAGATWGPGETPALKGILEPGVIELSGTAYGGSFPKEWHMQASNLQDGDEIVMLASSGIHANGLTDARAVAEMLPQKYATVMEDGRMYGEALLVPTLIYVDSLIRLHGTGAIPHYAVNLTGHGWRKLMRSPGNFTYEIDRIPHSQPEFDLIQQYSGKTDKDMYGTFNMGAGFVYFMPSGRGESAADQIRQAGYDAAVVGRIKTGPRKVVIKPKNIVFESKDLKIR